MSPLRQGLKGAGAGPKAAPRLDSVAPGAAMPGSEVELRGEGLQGQGADLLPEVTVGDGVVPLTLSRPGRAVVQIPEGIISGEVVLAVSVGAGGQGALNQGAGNQVAKGPGPGAPGSLGQASLGPGTLRQAARQARVSNPLQLRVAVPMAEGLNPVANPAVDSGGTVYATVSGPRGQSVPVSIFSIAGDFQMRPFVRDLLNATGLAFGPDGYLYVSSRAEGTVYRVSPEGLMSTYAEGLGIATGIAFDGEGNLFVGDRSGTIFKVGPDAKLGGNDVAGGSVAGESSEGGLIEDRETFVYATLEPSIAAYHLAFNDEGVLYVTGPTTSSNQAVHAIDREGRVTVFYQGLGRAQGMAFDVDGNLYVAASLRGQRGIVRITPGREATLAVSGNDLVGLAFLEDGCAALATKDALYHAALDIEGRKLV